ncbi:MAG TPA: ferrous iron transport protein B [Bacillota bacterium]|nr:ferrous iron transport protein B [Bacillota bacterium]
MRLVKPPAGIKFSGDDSRSEAGRGGPIVVALAGNPNTGKSTVFNSLTGMKQHTGNWSGKTVAHARGRYSYRGQDYLLVDLPGSYSLLAASAEEEVARDYICFERPDVTVVVADATCLERNLNLVLQILEITSRVVVCVNLIDEAERKKIRLDLPLLSRLLGVPVVGTNARDGRGLRRLQEAVYRVASGEISTKPLRVEYGRPLEEAAAQLVPAVREIAPPDLDSRWLALRLLEGDSSLCRTLERRLKKINPQKSEALAAGIDSARALLERQGGGRAAADLVVAAIFKTAAGIARQVARAEGGNSRQWDRRLDRLLTSKSFGIPVMLALLGVVFWITLAGANYPSQLLAEAFFRLEERLGALFSAAGAPPWLEGALLSGIYRTLAWVISVMLPPMAIFFPLFSYLEDLGYLPRVAFNLDSFFRRAGAHGKQALTMCMGFGCNAAGVIACRIIDSPRERLIAVLTNNYAPCNGRFPTLIVLASIFIGGGGAGAFSGSFIAAAAVLAAIVFATAVTLGVSKILSQTVLKGLPSTFVLELPPYRKPHLGRILARSFVDRTLFVLSRAAIVAAPAGLLIWLLAHTTVGDFTLLQWGARLLHPFGSLLGMDGYIVMAFLLGFPANEIVIPIVIMSYLSSGALLELSSLEQLQGLLLDHGWSWLTAVCVMLFSLNHFPCGTTLLTIYRETRSLKWTAAAFLIPTLTGMVICFLVAQTARLLGLA